MYSQARADLPLPIDRRARDAQRLRGFVDRESAEESQLGDAAFSWIERRELRQRRVQIEKIDIRRRRSRDRVVKRHAGPSAGALGHLAAPRVVHEDAPHHLGRHGEELRAILPVGVSLVDQAEVRLVDQGGRLQEVSRAARAAAAPRPGGEAPDGRPPRAGPARQDRLPPHARSRPVTSRSGIRQFVLRVPYRADRPPSSQGAQTPRTRPPPVRRFFTFLA